MTDFTTTGLLANVKRRGSLPTNNTLVTTANFISFLSDELNDYIMPLILSVNEEFFVASTDVSVVSGTALYDLPVRAIGLKLRDVVRVNDDGTELTMPRWTREQRTSEYAYNAKTAFYMQGNQIGVYPSPTENFTMRLYYLRRPNTLVNVEDAAKVSSIAGNVLTCSNVPSDIITGSTVDVINGGIPFNAHFEGVTVSDRTGFDITLSDVTNIAAGDYVCTATESPIPQVPYEAFGLLEEAVCLKVFEALDDEKAYKIHKRRLEGMEKRFIDTITPRVEGESKKLVSSRSLSNHVSSRGWI